MLKVVFVSNGLNTHVLPLMQAFLHHPEISFTFVSCEKEGDFAAKSVVLTPEEQSYVIAYEPIKAQNLIDEADVLLLGMADPSLLKKAAKKGTLIFHYSEHFSKNKNLMPLRYLHNHLLFGTISRHQGYLLATSSFAQADFAKAHLYRNKALYWGYFPEGNRALDLTSKTFKKGRPVRLLYAGRLLFWKHPEMALEAAQTLYEAKIPFEVKIIGDGERMPLLKEDLAKSPYKDSVDLLGYQDNAEVLKAMAWADIFLFSSDRGEGWGATLNEAMSSRCAVLASTKAGATGFLVQDGVNGFVYSDETEFQKKLLRLVNEEGLGDHLASNAQKSIQDEWNAAYAVDHLLQVVDYLLNKKEIPEALINGGPGTFIR